MPDSISPTFKICTRCEGEKPLEDFPPHKRGRLGRDSHCRMCHRSASKARYWADPERGRQEARAFRDQNPDYQSEWAERNPSRRRGHRWSGSYRERMAKYGHQVEVVETFGPDEVIARYGDSCWHCEDGPFEHLDHFPVAVLHGGPHALDNVKPSCASCNFKTSAEIRDAPPTPATA